MITLLKTLMTRNLEQLKQEIQIYKNEIDLWKTTPEIANSGGNLCLHLIGNLNHFIGAVLGKTEYIRNREFEFSEKNIPVEQLMQRIDETMKIISNTLDQLKIDQLENDYPIEVFNSKIKTNDFLFYLTTHLSYHLGQINYHRRMINN
jgi:serine kinase of HPr protein (carbohydrate metabolism regulator)